MRTAYIAMGTNLPSPIGPPVATLHAAVTRLATLGRVLHRSSLYSTAPVGLTDQPRFVNAVLALETSLSPLSLLDRLLDIERGLGRDRSSGVPNGPRTLDLDILLMGDLRIGESNLELPHPRLADRGFVLIPLHEIAPHAVDSRHHATIAELLNRWRAEHPNEISAVVPLRDVAWDVHIPPASGA
jgi:2-amino-4-hydroxy-6-hydroxymethyldihydropteridine diphosphokinase